MCDNVLFPAPPLSVENVLAVLETHHWRDIGDNLHVPDSKLDFIASENSTDRQRLAAVVRYWILRDPFASWRKLIHTLDECDYRDVADRIRKYAEKQTGE